MSKVETEIKRTKDIIGVMENINWDVKGSDKIFDSRVERINNAQENTYLQLSENDIFFRLKEKSRI